MVEDQLEEHFKRIYASKLEQELQNIFVELEKIGLISKLNILYWNPELNRYQIEMLGYQI